VVELTKKIGQMCGEAGSGDKTRAKKRPFQRTMTKKGRQFLEEK